MSTACDRIDYAQLLPKRVIAQNPTYAKIFEAAYQEQKVAVKEFMFDCDFDITGYCEEPPCIVTELCECNLAALLRNQPPIKYDKFYNWTLQIASGMEYLHKNNIAHRDLKSENVLMNVHGRLVLCDFDFSKKVEEANAMMTTLISTPYWTAPEIVRSQPYTAKASYRSRNVVVIFSMIRIKFPVELHGDWIEILGRCIQDEAAFRPDFSLFLNIMPTLMKYSESDWLYMKQIWMNSPIEYWKNISPSATVTEQEHDNNMTIMNYPSQCWSQKDDTTTIRFVRPLIDMLKKPPFRDSSKNTTDEEQQRTLVQTQVEQPAITPQIPANNPSLSFERPKTVRELISMFGGKN